MSQCRSLAVRSVTMLLGGDSSWTWAALEHTMGFYSPTPRAARARDRVVHLGAYAVRTGDFPEHPGGLGAHGG